MLQYRPLRFFWIAEFSDGTATAQFDPDTGEEVQGHPDWLPSKTDDKGMTVEDGENGPYSEAYRVPQHLRGKQVIRLGWYPFSSELAKKIFWAAGNLSVPSGAKALVVEVKDGEEPVCYRSHSIKLNVRGGGVEYTETVYVLGIKGKKILQMNEKGRILN
jgi:hypothetical protein